MRGFLVSAFCLLASVTTSARAAQADLWQGTMAFTAAPTPGREVGGEERSGDQNQSSYALRLRITRRDVPLVGQISAEVESNYRPDYLKRGPQSRLRLHSVLGNAPIVLGGEEAGPRGDTLRLRLDVFHDKVWSVCRAEDGSCPKDPSGFFEGEVRRDVTVGAGAVYATQLKASEPDIELRLAASASRLWSSRPERNRWTPRAQASVLVGPFGPGIRPFVQAAYDLRLHDKPWSGMDRARRDRNLQIGAGADLEDWVGHGIDALQIGVLYYRRRSNRANAGYTRGFFAPRLTLARRF